MAVKRALDKAAGGNKSVAVAAMKDDKKEVVGDHPNNATKQQLRLEPTEGAFDRWRLFKIHNFAVKADRWQQLSNQKVSVAPFSDAPYISRCVCVCGSVHITLNRFGEKRKV